MFCERDLWISIRELVRFWRGSRPTVSYNLSDSSQKTAPVRKTYQMTIDITRTLHAVIAIVFEI